jgi:DNA invertase Pin-like site-specific DNA recombinase
MRGSAGPIADGAAELKAAGCQRVFQEKISGAGADRKQLARLLVELDDR